MKKHSYPPSRIYNMYETGVSTVPNKVPKLYAEKGKRAVCKIVSADRGQLVTAVRWFKACGLRRLDENIFGDDEFAANSSRLFC